MIALPDAQLESFTAEQVRFAAGAWPLRAAEELRSALTYRALAAASESVLGGTWPARFRAVAIDEVRHARICADVGDMLHAPAPRYDAALVRARLSTLADPVARTGALLLAEVAIGETISMALFRAGRRGTTEPVARAVLESILADEVRHQRLGWDGLTALWPALPDRRREALQLEAARTFAAVERRTAVPALRSLEAGERFDPAWSALGVLPFETRVEAFYLAIERFVIPRLTRLGLDGARAWSERYREVIR